MASGGVYIFGTSNALVINNSNSCVGVGNSNPQYPLDVSGNVNVAGNVSASNLGTFRNRIINGDMRLDQGLTASNAVICGSMTASAATATSAASNALDKWQAATGAGPGTLVAQQVALSTADQATTGGMNKATILSQVPMNGLTTYMPFEGSNLMADTVGNIPVTANTASISNNARIGSTCLSTQLVILQQHIQLTTLLAHCRRLF